MSKIRSFAKALYNLKKIGAFDDPHCKSPIKIFIREASETSSHHSSVHYVSTQLIKENPEYKYEGKSKHQKYCNERFKHEHIAPVEFIYKKIQNAKNMTLKEIEDLLSTLSIRATILKSENDRLNEKYKSTMPEGFEICGHKYHNNPRARYDDLGIKLTYRSKVKWLKNI